jgi:flavin-dependent dehydrogenase
MENDFPRKPGVTFSNIDGSKSSNWCFNKVIDNESYLSFHVRRSKFDQLLLQHANSLGCEVWEEHEVVNVDLDSSPTSARIQCTHNGTANEIEARFVIDASGQYTFLGRQMGTRKSIPEMKKRVAHSTHWENIKMTPTLRNGNLQIVQLEGEKQGWVWLIPVDENRLSIGVVLDTKYVRDARKRYPGNEWTEDFYVDELKSSSVVAEIISEAKMVMPLAINGDYSYTNENKFGSNFALVGDASAFLDPIFSSGIYLGIRSAQLVSQALLSDHKMESLQTVYEDIDGGYKLVTKLINTFYDEGSIKFAEAQDAIENSYEKFESAYAILHLILAGDFFTNYKKYLDAITLLQDQKMIAKYKNLIRHEDTRVAPICT